LSQALTLRLLAAPLLLRVLLTQQQQQQGLSRRHQQRALLLQRQRCQQSPSVLEKLRQVMFALLLAFAYCCMYGGSGAARLLPFVKLAFTRCFGI
jgi:hypothetical protein